MISYYDPDNELNWFEKYLNQKNIDYKKLQDLKPNGKLPSKIIINPLDSADSDYWNNLNNLITLNPDSEFYLVSEWEFQKKELKSKLKNTENIKHISGPVNHKKELIKLIESI